MQQQSGLIIPFQDTNPPGQRRGAILQKEDGSMHLVNDEEKWKIVRSGFAGCKALSGTSSYFESGDEISETEKLKDSKMGIATYLIEYIDKEGQNRWSYFACNTHLTRSLAFTIISRHMLDHEAKWFRANELEYYGSNCHARDEHGKIYDLYSTGTRPRFDLYFMK